MEDRDECALAAIRGDEAELLRRIDMDKRQLYGIAFVYMRSEEEALEVIQETVCRVWAKRRMLREAKYFTTWMIRILIRVHPGGLEPARYYYKIPKEHYTQPLTFRVKQYPGYILEPISIAIK